MSWGGAEGSGEVEKKSEGGGVEDEEDGEGGEAGLKIKRWER